MILMVMMVTITVVVTPIKVSHIGTGSRWAGWEGKQGWGWSARVVVEWSVVRVEGEAGCCLGTCCVGCNVKVGCMIRRWGGGGGEYYY